ncbi:MAG: YegS/Rv2252/BmrU family lipid kinase [Bacteroidota bacterium]
MKNVLFIINPISGVGRKKEIETIVESTIDKSKFIYSITFTEYAGHATIIAMDAKENGFDIVYVVGGDGSINEVATGLLNTDIVLGIIPSGSGNGLARFLKLPFDIKRNIVILNNYKTTLIDTIDINNKCCVSIAGIGFDALVAKEFDKLGRRGFWGYLKIVSNKYFNYKPKKYTISIGEKTFERRALFISIANSNQFGYNTVVAPLADICDGLADICIYQKVSIFKVLFYALFVFAKRIHKTKYVEIIKASEFVIERKKKKWINIDGQPMKLNKKLYVKVLPKSLRVIVP